MTTLDEWERKRNEIKETIKRELRAAIVGDSTDAFVEWKCRRCGADGVVVFRQAAAGARVAKLIEINHAANAPACEGFR